MMRQSFRFLGVKFTLLFLLLAGVAVAETYTLPDDAGSEPFNNCSLINASTLECNDNIELDGNGDIILLSQDLTWIINGNLILSANNIEINNGAPFQLTIELNGNLEADQNNIHFYADLTTTGDIEFNNNLDWQGDITADGSISMGNNTEIIGDVSADGDFDLGNGSTVTGNCSADGGNYADYCTVPSADICEDFENGFPSDWTITGSGDAGVNDDTSNSPDNSLYLSGEAVQVTTENYDFSSADSVEFTLWYQRGDDSFSEDPDGGEDIEIQYRDSNGNWQTITSQAGNGQPGQEYTLNYTATTTLHNNFAIRFNKTDGDAGDFDYWHVDDYCYTVTGGVTLPTPVLEYRFDEQSWSGVTNEVADTSGNNRHGVADASSNTTTTADAAICRAASFNGSNQFITSNHLSQLNDTASLSFWIKTTDAGTGQASESPAVTGVDEADGSDDVFWGWLNTSGNVGITTGNDDDTFSGISVNNNVYHHIVLSRDAATDAYEIYVDGTLSASGTFDGDSAGTGTIGNLFSSIGRVESTDGTFIYLDALIDEFIVFDEVLSGDQVSEIYSLQSNGQNLDGSTRDCSYTPPTCFSDDFNRTDLETNWITTSTSGSFGQPRIVNNRLRLTDATTSNSTGATVLRRFPSQDNIIVVEFTFYAYDGTGSNGVAAVFSDASITPNAGAYAGSLGYAQLDDPIDGFAGGWMGIGIDEFGNFLTSNDGREGGFARFVRDTLTIRGSGSGQNGYEYITSNGQVPNSGTQPDSLVPGIDDNATGHRYRITIDHQDGTNAWVTVERDDDLNGAFDTLIEQFDMQSQSGQAAIPDRMFLTLTASTGMLTNIHEIDDLEVCANIIEDVTGELIDHYELDRDQETGLTCEPMTIISRACLDEDCTSQVSGLVTTEFSPVEGWQTSNTKTDYSSGDSFLFQPTVAGTYTLDVTDTDPIFAPFASGDTQCFVNGVEQSDCEVEFVDTALRFFEPADSSSSISELNLVAGQQSSNISMQVVETNTTTGQCDTVFVENSSVNFDIGTSCDNPASCAIGNAVTWHQTNDTLLANPENQIGGADTSSVAVEFAADSTAEFSLTSSDLGLQTLSAAYEFLDLDGNPSGELITGSLTLRARPASLLIDNVTSASGTSNNPDDVFATASEQFTLSLVAEDINGAVLPSLGRVNGLFDVDWSSSSLVSPVGGVFGALEGDSLLNSSAATWTGADLDSDSNGDNEAMIFSAGEGLTYGEVGSIDIQATINDFLGSGIAVNSQSERVGRFISAYLQVTQVDASASVIGVGNAPQWGISTNAYQGYEETLENLYFQITAYDNDNNPLNNYDGSELNLATPNTADSLAKDATDDAVGGDLASTVSWSYDSDENFDGTVTLSAEAISLLWNQDVSGPSADDELAIVTQLTLPATTFTDSDGICVLDDAADTDCNLVVVDIADESLYLARLVLPDQVSTVTTTMEIELTLEYLQTFDATNPVFAIQSTESDFDDLIIAGLDHSEGSMTCTIAGCAAAGSNVADSANGTLATPDGTGSTLLNGEGLLTVDSVTPVTGIVEVEAQVPDWLYWDWDGDGNDEADRTLLIFNAGQFQGRPPVLFIEPGFR